PSADLSALSGSISLRLGSGTYVDGVKFGNNCPPQKLLALSPSSSERTPRIISGPLTHVEFRRASTRRRKSNLTFPPPAPSASLCYLLYLLCKTACPCLPLRVREHLRPSLA